jgi:hypothetical protein
MKGFFRPGQKGVICRTTSSAFMKTTRFPEEGEGKEFMAEN